ncbi:hypothetical protein Efla_002501 [Eimeria flavescens]
MIIAFTCLASFAIVGSVRHPQNAAVRTLAECEMGSWSEWTVCPEACGIGKETRERLVIAAPGISFHCPEQKQERDCSGTCNIFIITREASTTTNSLASQQLIYNSRLLTSVLGQALDIKESRVALSSLGLDSSSGKKYWRVQFFIHVDLSLPSSNPDSDLGSDPQRTLKLLAERLADKSMPTSQQLDNILPGLDNASPFRLQAYTATPSTLVDPVDMCLLLGPEAPSTCACKVSDWSEWTVCDRQCQGMSSTRTRSVLNPSSSASLNCPALTDKKRCTGQTKLYSLNMPAGLDLGSISDVENRLQICKDAVLRQLQTLFRLDAPERVAFGGSSADKKLWTFSMNIEDHTEADQIGFVLDEAMQNPNSTLFVALSQCMATSGLDSLVPKVSVISSPGDVASSESRMGSYPCSVPESSGIEKLCN